MFMAMLAFTWLLVHQVALRAWQLKLWIMWFYVFMGVAPFLMYLLEGFFSYCFKGLKINLFVI